jgi:hypothetical protein
MTLCSGRRLTFVVCGAALAALLFIAPPSACGLATEHFGNAPVPDGWGFAPGLLPLLNDSHRVYWYEVNGDAWFSFQGDTAVAHDLLLRFAALEKGLEVVVLPGPRQMSGLGGERKLTADWELHVPGGIHLGGLPDGALIADTKPTLYLYVRADPPVGQVTPAQLARWLTDLNADDFAVRERAVTELEKQGRAAEPALRKALEQRPALEVRRRIEVLLDKLPGVNLSVLTVPEGVRVVGPDDRLARYRKGLKSEDATVRGVAAGLAARWDPEPAAGLATLIKTLADKNEYPRRCAAGDLGRMGKAAAPALPVLRAGLDDPDQNVRNAFQWAVTAIESAKDEPGAAERAEKERFLRQEIGRFLKTLPARAKE